MLAGASKGFEELDCAVGAPLSRPGKFLEFKTRFATAPRSPGNS